MRSQGRRRFVKMASNTRAASRNRGLSKSPSARPSSSVPAARGCAVCRTRRRPRRLRHHGRAVRGRPRRDRARATRACDDPDKGKGVFAIAPIAEARSRSGSPARCHLARALDRGEPRSERVPASPHVVCAECRCAPRADVGATATPRPVARRVDRAAGRNATPERARARARDGDSFFPRPPPRVGGGDRRDRRLDELVRTKCEQPAGTPQAHFPAPPPHSLRPLTSPFPAHPPPQHVPRYPPGATPRARHRAPRGPSTTTPATEGVETPAEPAPSHPQPPPCQIRRAARRAETALAPNRCPGNKKGNNTSRLPSAALLPTLRSRTALRVRVARVAGRGHARALAPVAWRALDGVGKFLAPTAARSSSRRGFANAIAGGPGSAARGGRREAARAAGPPRPRRRGARASARPAHRVEEQAAFDARSARSV